MTEQTITLGWWIVPALTTAIVIAINLVNALKLKRLPGTDDDDLGPFMFGAASIIFCLFVWLVWAFLA